MDPLLRDWLQVAVRQLAMIAVQAVPLLTLCWLSALIEAIPRAARSRHCCEILS